MKRIYAKEEVCIGCRLCEIHCITQHSRSKKIIKAFKEDLGRLVPRMFVEEKGPLSFAVQCRHCEDAQCVAACMTGAMQKDPVTGAVSQDPDKCVGCWMCIMVCPTGAIRRNTKQGKVASKCDLCGEEETPVCVARCPNEALSYEDREEGNDE